MRNNLQILMNLKNDLIKFIDFYKQRANEYFDSYQFDFHDSNKYDNFGEFTDHINQQAYQIHFSEISKKYIDKCVEDGKLYLFQIYNKDFSPYSITQMPTVRTT